MCVLCVSLAISFPPPHALSIPGIADGACYPTNVTAANGTKPTPSPGPGPGPSPGPPGNKWHAIDELDCTDAACTKCKDNGSFETNTCLETTQAGLYIKGACADDGASISELTFSDSACSEQTGSYPVRFISGNGGMCVWG